LHSGSPPDARPRGNTGIGGGRAGGTQRNFGLQYSNGCGHTFYGGCRTILADRKNLGCKRLIEKNPELVTVLEMPNDHVLMDLDTPEAYANLTQRLCANGTAPESMNLTG